MAKVSRSQFVQKLHEILTENAHPDDLRWVGNDSFEITSDDKRARAALSSKWDFRSLSSFIRQLSYYNFKRLSDRRRSVERRTTTSSFIVFSHPSGHFLRDDSSGLEHIARKLRARKSQPSGTRKSSIGQERSPSPDHMRRFSYDEHSFEGKPELPYSFEGYRPQAQWAPPLPQHHGADRKPTFQLPGFADISGSQHTGWNDHSSPYPSPLHASSHYPPQPAYQYAHAPSYFQALQHSQHQQAQMAEHAHARGAVVAPPSPTESHPYHSGSPLDEEEPKPFFGDNKRPMSYYSDSRRSSVQYPQVHSDGRPREEVYHNGSSAYASYPGMASRASVSF